MATLASLDVDCPTCGATITCPVTVDLTGTSVAIASIHLEADPLKAHVIRWHGPRETAPLAA